MRIVLASLLAASMMALMSGFAAKAEEAPLSYDGKTVLITGSTDGLGQAVARVLAAEGAHVIVHGRNAERGQALVEEIEESGGSASFYAADFASLDAVRDFADTIAAQYPVLDLLVNNAGVLIAGDRRVSDDGHELQFAVNYLAGWILTHRLRPNLAAAAPSRVINVSSIAAAPVDFDDVMLEQPGAAGRGYGQSKLAQVTMTVALAEAFAEDGITMVSMHPATMMDTTMVRDMGVQARTSVDEGRDHLVGLIVAPELKPGAFYVNGAAVQPGHSQPYDPEAQQRLLALSADLTGVAAQ